MKTDSIVLKETGYLAIAVAVCSLVMQGVFLIAGAYDWTVLFGSLLGGGAAILNFFVMGRDLEKATAQENPADAKKQMRASYSTRYFLLGAVVVLAVLKPEWFHWIPTALSLAFPRLWFLVMPLIRKDLKEQTEEDSTV